MAVGQGAQDAEDRLERYQRLTLEGTLQRVDGRGRQRGERRQRAVPDLAAVAVRLAQQDRDVFLALVDTPDSGHVHRSARPPSHAHIIPHLADMSSHILATKDNA